MANFEKLTDDQKIAFFYKFKVHSTIEERVKAILSLGGNIREEIDSFKQYILDLAQLAGTTDVNLLKLCLDLFSEVDAIKNSKDFLLAENKQRQLLLLERQLNDIKQKEAEEYIEDKRSYHKQIAVSYFTLPLGLNFKYQGVNAEGGYSEFVLKNIYQSIEAFCDSNDSLEMKEGYRSFYKDIQESIKRSYEYCDFSFNGMKNLNAHKELKEIFDKGELVYLPASYNTREYQTGHGFAVVIKGDLLIVTDRGPGYGFTGGTKIFRLINDISEEHIKNIIFSKDCETIYNTIRSLIDEDKPLASIKQKEQDYGNCVYANPRSSIEGMLLVLAAELIDGGLVNTNPDKLEELKSEVRTQQKRFTCFERTKYVKELSEKLKIRQYETEDTVNILDLFVKVSSEYIKQHGNDLKPGTEERVKILTKALTEAGYEVPEPIKISIRVGFNDFNFVERHTFLNEISKKQDDELYDFILQIDESERGQIFSFSGLWANTNYDENKKYKHISDVIFELYNPSSTSGVEQIIPIKEPKSVAKAPLILNKFNKGKEKVDNESGHNSAPKLPKPNN